MSGNLASMAGIMLSTYKARIRPEMHTVDQNTKLKNPLLERATARIPPIPERTCQNKWRSVRFHEFFIWQNKKNSGNRTRLFFP